MKAKALFAACLSLILVTSASASIVFTLEATVVGIDTHAAAPANYTWNLNDTFTIAYVLPDDQGFAETSSTDFTFYGGLFSELTMTGVSGSYNPDPAEDLILGDSSGNLTLRGFEGDDGDDDVGLTRNGNTMNWIYLQGTVTGDFGNFSEDHTQASQAFNQGTYAISMPNEGDLVEPLDSGYVTASTIESAGVSYYLSANSISIVPEPSTYAALAGLLVLGFVIYRRRR